MGETAILMAAGMGTRMRPLTDIMPKPLITVHGVPMIETIITGLLQRPVERIYIITGYMGEKFQYLERKYPQVKLIENPDYRRINNISSLYAARAVLGQTDCFICEADLWVHDKGIFGGKFSHSCYFARQGSVDCRDWGFTLADGRVTYVGKGPGNLFQMVGIAYFRQAEAATISAAIQNEYGRPGYEDLFWDDVVDRNLEKLKLKLHFIREGQIEELDTVAELAAADKSYAKWISK